MYDVVYIFRGMLIGLMVSVPLGPMGVLIIQKTLHKGGLIGVLSPEWELLVRIFLCDRRCFWLGVCD